MKAAVVCLLLVAVATVSVESFVDQSRIIGSVGFGDRLLDQEVASQRGKGNTVVVSNYVYPKYGRGSVITCIKVVDRWLNGSNGDLFINSGGVGQRSVSMSIRSHVGLGLDYVIETWGRSAANKISGTALIFFSLFGMLYWNASIFS